MGKKKSHDDDGDGDEPGTRRADAASDRCAHRPPEPAAARSAGGLLPALSVGDILALLTLIVLSAALLLEGYHKEFKDYSKEIIALFAIVVGFLLGRKT